jgi:hypothetical protein
LVQIQPYSEPLVPAARDFNLRLDQSGTHHFIRLPESATPGMLESDKGAGFFQECFVAIDNGAVRGGYILYHQAWSIAGERVAVGNAMRPISEGVIARAYSLVGVALIQHAMRREPLQFGLGLGGEDEAITRMLSAMRWDIWPVPMYFRVLNGRRFAEEFRPIRTRRALSLAADVAARTGLASAAIQVAGLPARWRKRGVEIERVDRFSGWADNLWQQALHAYSVLEWRDTAVLNDLFAGRPQYFCLKISERGRTVGWAVLDQMSTIRTKFGGMQVYTILDCLALPRDAEAVIAAATRYLAGLGADVILSYQTHPAWRKALRRAGFYRRPSTFLFGSATELTRRMRAADATRSSVHLTRGGGDVPVAWDSRVKQVQPLSYKES